MEEIVMELKRAAEAVEKLVARIEKQGEELMQKIEAQSEKLAARIEKISAAVEEDEAPVRKTLPTFLAKVMAEAEGRDPKEIDQMLCGLAVEQRIAVKMQMVRAGMI
jgi:hypothetical protein